MRSSLSVVCLVSLLAAVLFCAANVKAQEDGELEHGYVHVVRVLPEDFVRQRRKSAYMRFGKRSAWNNGADEESLLNMDKRKSAFMRFGRRR